MVLKTLWDPVVSSKHKERLIEILNKGTEDEDELREAVGILKDSGSMESADQKAKHMVE